MKKLLVVLVAALALLFGPVVPASAATVTVTLDADGTGLPVAEAAADWSKNTGITVVAGECTTGNLCVHFKITPSGEAQPCSTAGVAGCAYGLADGSCQVEVSGYYISLPGADWLDDLVVRHEAGHCIFRVGGLAVNYHLSDSPHALMSATQPIRPTRNEARLTSVDRSFTQTLFG